MIFNHILFLVIFQIDPSLSIWSSCYLTSLPVLLYIRNVSVPVLSHLLSVYRLSARVALGQQF